VLRFGVFETLVDWSKKTPSIFVLQSLLSSDKLVSKFVLANIVNILVERV
jgi:hypothetical protein